MQSCLGVNPVNPVLGSYHPWLSCAYMQFAVIYTIFSVMGYKALHGVTWRYGYMVIYHLVFCCQQF
jgi:hypothetical protein